MLDLRPACRGRAARVRDPVRSRWPRSGAREASRPHPVLRGVGVRAEQAAHL